MSSHEKMLLALKESKGEWISSQVLSLRLEVAKDSLEILAGALLTSGYDIEVSPERGYRLASSPDLLIPEEVCPGLATKIFGRQHYFYYSEIDSTNTCAQDLAAKGYPEGTVVVSEEQTAGRGRRGRSWYSPPRRGIYMSVILRPVLSWTEISRISLVAAVALAETLEAELNLAARIKWPNDILINGRKIAGILSETATNMDGINYVVTGIGVNINNLIEEFPDGLRTPPTSVRAENQQVVSRVRLMQGLLTRLEEEYYRLLEGRFSETLAKGKSLSLAIGQMISFETANGPAVGRAIDLDENGSLLVRDDSRIIHTVISGEIAVESGDPS